MPRLNFTQSGEILSIDLTDIPKNPTNAQAELTLKLLSDALGTRFGAVKVSGYWILGTMVPRWRPVFGHEPGNGIKSFDKLIREYFQIATVRIVPLKTKV
jgi:hypothetical protein